MLDGERQLIKRAIKGEAEAFGLLYDRYQPAIYRFIYLKVSHREEAEDLTHQVFLQSWEKISEFEFQGFAFSSWLYRVARNKVIDYYRAKKVHIDIEDVLDDVAELIAENELLEKLDSKIDLVKIEEAIKKLKHTERDVVILRFVEELSPAEVAQIIDRTPEAVRLIQHRALKNLRQILNSNR